MSFNIAFAVHVNSAIALLTSELALSGADVILLQEMDAQATQRVADALDMWYGDKGLRVGSWHPFEGPRRNG